MDTLRKIEPLPGVTIDKVDPGPRPEVLWVPPTDLLVDEAYQRDLSRRSIELIIRMAKGFSFRRMKPPIVARVDSGLHVVDGQHTAIAAAMAGVDEIMVVVNEVPDVKDRAGDFVAHNRDRVVMSPFDIFRGLVKSGDAYAVATERAISAAGIRVRPISPYARNLPGDTGAIGSVQRIVKRNGVPRARAIFESFKFAGRGPVSAAELDACELVMERRPRLGSDVMAETIKHVGDEGFAQAQMKARLQKRMLRVVLAEVYEQVLDHRAKKGAA